MLLFLILLVSACKKTGAAAGTAPRTPFIGGTSGIIINFEKDSPPPEVTDVGDFQFKAIARLKNDGEFKVEKDKIAVNLVGFDPQDFNAVIDDMRDQRPEDDLDSKKRDAEGSLIEGTTTFVNFPSGIKNFEPKSLSGNTEFTFRADVCYNYQTKVNSKLCVLRDLINVRDDSLCKPTGSKTVHSSSAPVQVTNFRQSVVGKDKLSFSFDVSLSGNVDVFWSSKENLPSKFDNGCPRTPKDRRQVENKVGVEVKTVPEADTTVKEPTCGGLDGKSKGVVTLVSGKRTVTCTAELDTNRLDLEKVVEITLKYNALDNKETKVLVKHLAEVNP